MAAAALVFGIAAHGIARGWQEARQERAVAANHPDLRQLADFLQAIETGRPPMVDGREGRRAVQIILGIYKSAQTGSLVEL